MILEDGSYKLSQKAFMTLWVEYKTNQAEITVYEEFVLRLDKTDELIEKGWGTTIERLERCETDLYIEQNRPVFGPAKVALVSLGSTALGVAIGIILVSVL